MVAYKSMLGNFSCFLLSADVFNNKYLKKNTNVKQFGSRLGQMLCPDLCPSCLQGLLVDDKSCH